MSDYKPDIWRLQGQLDIQGLVKALTSADANIRKRAAAALRAMGAREAVPALRVALVREQDADARASINAALEGLSDEGEWEEQAEITPELNVVNHLIAQLRQGEGETLIQAARELGELGDKLAVEPLVLLFQDQTQSIQARLAVAEALLKLEAAPVEVTLLATLRHEDWHIRRNGAAILGQLRADWAIPPLAKTLSDAHPIVRRTARAALRHIGTPEARRALASATQAMRQARQDAPPGAARGLRDRMKAEDGDTTATTDAGSQAPARHADDPTDPQPRSIQQARQGGERRLTDTDKLRSLNPTQPLDPDVLAELEQRQTAARDGDEPEGSQS